MIMIRFGYLSVVALCLASGGTTADDAVAEGTAPGYEGVARRELTNGGGYVIRYGDELYRYPVRIEPVVRTGRPLERNPTETNEIENGGEYQGRPLFYFTSYEGEGRPLQRGPKSSGPYIEIRRKRDVADSEIPESSKIGKLRRKRTYCRKCGGGGGGGRGGGYYAVPVSYVAYPVLYGGGGGGGGGGKGCYSCGGGGGGYGGGGGGSYSYSSSSAQSSSGSYGWGKK